MKFICFFLLFLVFLGSCSNEQKENASKKEKKQFEMYEHSEMASMMLYMFDFNKQLKAEIQSDKSLSDFPKEFEQISELKMTDGHVKDDFFEQHIASFLNHQKEIYANPKNRVENFNAMVESCIACHKVKCTGPIPKIKQLYIAD